jgi:hypothetical protein
MSGNRWLVTVHYKYRPKTTYLFSDLHVALQCIAIAKRKKPGLRINLIRKELSREQCEAVLRTGQRPI